MTRKEAALLEMVKRGGTINERRIACEKLMLLCGKDYSYLLPREDLVKENSIVTRKLSFHELVEKIKNNFPIYFDYNTNSWRGKNGWMMTMEEMMYMPTDECKLLKQIFSLYSKV